MTTAVSTAQLGILQGIHDLVDEWLEIPPVGKAPYYRHRAAAVHVRDQPPTERRTRQFLEMYLARINQNWQNAVTRGYFGPSKQNWRWKRHLEHAIANKSPEVLLERAIVRACGEEWSNQMPTASGLISATADRRAAVDLVQREGPTSFSFLELKVASDNPLYAAVEILMHGILFLWSKANLQTLKYDPTTQPVLSCSRVHLGVLAPAAYFDGLDLSPFQGALSRSLQDFGRRHAVDMGFSFQQFYGDITGTRAPGEIRSAVDNRVLVFAP